MEAHAQMPKRLLWWMCGCGVTLVRTHLNGHACTAPMHEIPRPSQPSCWRWVQASCSWPLSSIGLTLWVTWKLEGGARGRERGRAAAHADLAHGDGAARPSRCRPCAACQRRSTRAWCCCAAGDPSRPVCALERTPAPGSTPSRLQLGPAAATVDAGSRAQPGSPWRRPTTSSVRWTPLWKPV